jgi:hypothetical protein
MPRFYSDLTRSSFVLLGLQRPGTPVTNGLFRAEGLVYSPTDMGRSFAM